MLDEAAKRGLQEARIGFRPTNFFRIVGTTFRNGHDVLKRAKKWQFADQAPPCRLDGEKKNPAYPKICEGCPRQGTCQYENTGGCAVKVLLGTEARRVICLDGSPSSTSTSPAWQFEFAGYLPKAAEIKVPDVELPVLVRSLVEEGRIQSGVDWISGPKECEDASPNLGCSVGLKVGDK